MGLYDYVKCEYDLGIKNQEDIKFQTKDTPSQYLDLYVIDKDGNLLYEEYDIEDRSDENGTLLDQLRGMMTRVNHRLVKLHDFTGEIEFYDGKYLFSSYFVDGELKFIKRLDRALA